MTRLLLLALIQSSLLAGGQVLLKFGLGRMSPFGWTWDFWRSALLNWQFACCGVCFGCASLLWMYIIKSYPLSMSYPMISLSYIFGMVSAILFFHEDVSPQKWLGTVFIIIGCFLIAR